MDPTLRPVTPGPSPSRSLVEVNFAQTWDAKISTRTLTPSDFSSPTDKQRLLEIRSTADAVLVGVRTAVADRMTLGLPDPELRNARTRRGQPEFPLRILVSNSGRISPDLPVFHSEGGPILIFSTSQMTPDTRRALEKHATLDLQPGEELRIPPILEKLRVTHDVQHLVCEGGPRLLRTLWHWDLVDILNLTLCPKVFGGATAPTLSGGAGGFFEKSRRWSLERMRQIGDECFLRYTRSQH